MADNSSVRVDFLGDAGDLARAARQASGSVDRMARDSERSGSRVGKAFGSLSASAKAGLAGLVGGGLVSGGVAVFKMGAQLEAMANKAKTVFGPELAGVQKWAKANSAAMGLTSREVTGLAANYADLLVPMGFTRKQAAAMSTDVVGLSGALSQWSGGTKSAAEVSGILAKAVLGERDGLKELGISITEADVSARLAAQGQSKLTGAALEQAKAQATTALIFEKSKDAQAAYASGSNKLLTGQAKLTHGIKELRDGAVARLVPLMVKAGEKVGDLVAGFKAGTGAGGKLAEAVRAIRERFEKYGPVVLMVVKALAKVYATIYGALIPIFWKLQGVVIDVVASIIPPVLSLFSALVDGAAKAFGWVPGLGPKLKDAAKEFSAFKDAVNGELAKIKDQEVRVRLVADVDKAIGRGDLSVSEGGAAGVLARGGGRPIAPRAPVIASGGRPLAADRTVRLLQEQNVLLKKIADKPAVKVGSAGAMNVDELIGTLQMAKARGRTLGLA